MSFGKKGGRTYKHPRYGKVDSVTTILKNTIPKDVLVPWASKMAVETLLALGRKYASGGRVSLALLEKVAPSAKNAWRTKSQEAAEIGTEVHNAIEFYFKNGRYPDDISLDASIALEHFASFCKESDLQPVEVEFTVYGDIPYAGRGDLVAMMFGKKYLLDFKTSKAIYTPEMPLQLSAYAKPKGITNAGIIRLDKQTGIPEFADFSHCLDDSYSFFTHLVTTSLTLKDEKRFLPR